MSRDTKQDAERFVRFCIMTGHDLAGQVRNPKALKAKVDMLAFSLSRYIVPSYAVPSKTRRKPRTPRNS